MTEDVIKVGDRLLDLIRNKEWILFKKEVEELDAVQLVEMFDHIEEKDRLLIFRLLNNRQMKDVFKNLPHSGQQEIVEGLAANAEHITRLLNDIEPDDRTAFLEELPREVAQQLISQLSPDQRAIANQLLGYPRDSIGRLMTPEYVAIKPHYTVEQALKHIRKFGRDSETLNIVYIVDDRWNLIDDIRIREIILSEPTQLIQNLMDNRFVALNAYDDQEVAVKVLKEQDRVALPVTDSRGKLIGIVTFDDVLDVAEEETTEDFHKFGSVQSAVLNPQRAGIFDLYKKRIGWLLALVFINIFSGAVIANYESMIQSAVALIFFLPLLIDSAGNAGSQSATLMIRSIALGDVKMRDWAKLFSKEFMVALMLGLSMAVGVSLVSNFRAPDYIWIIAITMVLVVLIGSLIGMLLPFIFTKLKLDPATASAPLITSIADIVGVLIYFSVASCFLGWG